MIIVGAGSRGAGYASYAAAEPQKARVVGVAEPREVYRNRIRNDHGTDPALTVSDWRELADKPRSADAVVIATQDAMHTAPATVFAEKGYHILLEKPMAPTEAECRTIADAAVKNGVILAVGHVMRYTTYTQRFKQIVDSGVIGDIVSVEHLEPVGYWHQAHSYVRGNWRSEAESSSMLLAKSCHDLDWLRYIVGQPCSSISSFGSLKHFRRDEKPREAGNALRCTDCAFEPKCPYSALKIYLGRVQAGNTGWPVNVLTPDPTEGSVLDALEQGPYGRCVYECDNDVVDHQVVNMEFGGGVTASFTMTAFAQAGHRKTRVFGTLGSLDGDGSTIRRFDFLTDAAEEIDTAATDASILGGHGGGDYGLMSRFVGAVATNDPSIVLSGARESLETHLMVFAAERARTERRVVDVRV